MEKLKKELTYLDKTKTIAQRKITYNKVISAKMNPLSKENFNADTFEPLGNNNDMVEIADRQRIELPDRLPTHGLRAKEIREGQMIGMYESKQDLYLISAQIYNKLQDKIDDLQNQINNINNKIDKE